MDNRRPIVSAVRHYPVDIPGPANPMQTSNPGIPTPASQPLLDRYSYILDDSQTRRGASLPIGHDASVPKFRRSVSYIWASPFDTPFKPSFDENRSCNQKVVWRWCMRR